MMHILFQMFPCRACGRLVEEFGDCPWCGERMPLSRTTLSRFAVLVLAILVLLFFLPFSHAVAIFCAFAFATAAPAALFPMTAATVAMSALCHVMPVATGVLGTIAHHQVIWIFPAVVCVFSCMGGVQLPPIPARTVLRRICQAMKRSLYVWILASIVAAATAMSPSPTTILAVALCVFAWVKGARIPPAILVAIAPFFLLVFLQPVNAGGFLDVATLFAVTLVICGFVEKR